MHPPPRRSASRRRPPDMDLNAIREQIDRLDRQLVAGHVRSLLASHLVDVQTSSQHVVRPWFNGKADVAPPAPELASPPLLLLLLVLPPPELAPPPSFALVAWNFGSLWEGTLAKLPGAAALPGLEEVEDAPSASASSASMPSVKGVAVLFLLLSPEEEAWARGGAEGA